MNKNLAPVTGKSPSGLQFRLQQPWVDFSWIEFQVEDDWIVAYHVVRRKGTVVPIEVRMFAGPIDRPESVGQPIIRLVSESYLNSRLVRKALVDTHIREAHLIITGMEHRIAASLPHNRCAKIMAASMSKDRPRSGRKGRSDSSYAIIAACYVLAVKAGSTRPNEEVAQAANYSRDRIRDLLGDARRRDLLTKPPVSGKAGGELTPKAWTSLDSHIQADPFWQIVKPESVAALSSPPTA